MVDVFAVVIICVGVRIDETLSDGSRLLVVAESRAANYAFAVRALWDLTQGQWTRAMHFQLVKVEPGAVQDLAELPSLPAELRFMEDTRECARPGRALYISATAATFALAAASMFAAAVSFSTVVLGGSGAVVTYSAWTIGAVLWHPPSPDVED
jgi:hypothetical protein